MKLFLISQTQSNGWDTYDSAVVAAPNEEIAKHMNPENGTPMRDSDWAKSYSTWCSGPEYVFVLYIGEAHEDIAQGVVCASFNAG